VKEEDAARGHQGAIITGKKTKSRMVVCVKERFKGWKEGGTAP